MHGDDSRHHYHERARRSANLRSRPSQRGNQESCHDRTVNSRLRRESGRDGKCHGQRQRNQSDRHARNQVVQKLVQAVVAQAENRRGKPAIFQICGQKGSGQKARSVNR